MNRRLLVLGLVSVALPSCYGCDGGAGRHADGAVDSTAPDVLVGRDAAAVDLAPDAQLLDIGPDQAIDGAPLLDAGPDQMVDALAVDTTPVLFTTVPTTATQTLNAISGSSENNVWAVGDGGTIAHFDGASWWITNPGTSESLMNVAVLGSSEVWAVGTSSTIYACDLLTMSWSVSMSAATAPSGTVVTLHGFYSPSKLNRWAVGDNGTIFYKGIGSAWIQTSSPSTEHWYDIVDCGGAGLAVGASGAIARKSGPWTLETSNTTADLFGVWYGWSGVSGESPVHWAVGAGGTVVHHDGTGWSVRSVPTTNTLRDIWGSSPDNVWAVGEAGTVLRYDGQSWTPWNAGTTNDLLGVWVASNGTVWIVGELGGKLLRYP